MTTAAEVLMSDQTRYWYKLSRAQADAMIRYLLDSEVWFSVDTRGKDFVIECGLEPADMLILPDNATQS